MFLFQKTELLLILMGIVGHRLMIVITKFLKAYHIKKEKGLLISGKEEIFDKLISWKIIDEKEIFEIKNFDIYKKDKFSFTYGLLHNIYNNNLDLFSIKDFYYFSGKKAVHMVQFTSKFYQNNIIDDRFILVVLDMTTGYFSGLMLNESKIFTVNLTYQLYKIRPQQKALIFVTEAIELKSYKVISQTKILTMDMELIGAASAVYLMPKEIGK